MTGFVIPQGLKSYDDFHSEKRGGDVSIKSQLRGRPHVQQQQFRKDPFLKRDRSSQFLLHVMDRKKNCPARKTCVANGDGAVQVTLKMGMSAFPHCFKTCLGDFIECGKQPRLERTPHFSACLSCGHI